MNIQDFLAHHGLGESPFAEEDAQTDNVFKDHCIDNTYHPAWDKIFGNPGDPSTSIVFGEKGSGKNGVAITNATTYDQVQRRSSRTAVFRGLLR